MPTDPVEKGTKLFGPMAEGLYADPKVKEGSMMGFKYLRRDGAFFAKLPADRVQVLINELLHEAQTFASKA